MKRNRKIIVCLLLGVVLLIGTGVGIYLSDGYCADGAALETMAQTSETVKKYRDGNALFFVPEEPVAGMIFYPGGKVQCEAYAPLMQACAQKGILCALVRMPGNLAVLNPNAADGIREKYPEVTSWYIGGHSLGGAMAASYVSKHAEKFDGLILLAAYSTADLSKSGLRVVSVYGSEDGVLSRDKYAKYKANLPEDFEEHELSGGCHAYFGSYGPQDGDGVPRISNEEQIARTAEIIGEGVARKAAGI